MSKKEENLIKRYTLADILLHWTVALGFVLLIVSGYIIFFDNYVQLLNNPVGNVLRVTHRVGAVLFAVPPIIYFIFSEKRWGWLEAFKLGKSDLGWMKGAIKHYFVGKGEMPPAGKYSAGQKAYYICAIVFGLILTVTGIIIWFDLLSPDAGMVALFIHGVAALVLGAFFLVHVYLTTFHPHERGSFNSMVTGYMDKEYAKDSHELWYDEMMEEERKEKRTRQ